MMGKTDSRTLVLVGKTQNGKSASGNSILGKKMFKSNRGLFGRRVTNACELKTTLLKNDQILNVIDTPGLFYPSVDLETNGKEIASCIKLALDGIHAVLVVCSVFDHFSDEEKHAIASLQDVFGKRILDYMIFVFIGTDELEENGKTFEDVGRDRPEALKEILISCGQRVVCFDNKTKDQTKKANQLQCLLSHVNQVLVKNGGEPYTNEVFNGLKKWTRELQRQTEEFHVLKETKGQVNKRMTMLEEMEKMHVEHLKRTTEMIELMLLEKWMSSSSGMSSSTGCSIQ